MAVKYWRDLATGVGWQSGCNHGGGKSIGGDISLEAILQYLLRDIADQVQTDIYLPYIRQLQNGYFLVDAAIIFARCFPSI